MKTHATIHNAALAATLGVAPGATVQVETRGGVPVTREWRNRFKDSRIDGCVTIAQNVIKPKSKLGSTTKKDEG